MTKPRNNERATMTHQQKGYGGESRPKVARGEVSAGRTAYREDYQRDRGPDLDESQDGTECEQDSQYFR